MPVVRLPHLDRVLRDAQLARHVRRQPYFRRGIIDNKYFISASRKSPERIRRAEVCEACKNQRICFASLEILDQQEVTRTEVDLPARNRGDEQWQSDGYFCIGAG